MAAVPTQPVGALPTPPASQTPVPSGPPPGNYYLSEGLEGVEHQQYLDGPSFTRAIESLAGKLCSGNWSDGQYVVFSSVTQANLTHLNKIHNTRYKGLRFLYLNDEQVLVVKIVAGLIHESASQHLGDILKLKLVQMGAQGEIYNVGTTTFKGGNSRKEADCAFKPWMSRSRATDWPTLVIECGIWESRARLKVDSCWWLQNSGGKVKIVLLLAISKAEKKIRLEQWEMASGPNPEGAQSPPDPLRVVPKRIHRLDIVEGVAAGPPFTLDFNKIFLHRPGPHQSDIVLTAEDLSQYATHIWRGAK